MDTATGTEEPGTEQYCTVFKGESIRYGNVNVPGTGYRQTGLSQIMVLVPDRTMSCHEAVFPSNPGTPIVILL